MNIKKEYNKGDDVWIYGISISNKLTKGKVISSVDLSEQGHADVYYVIEIPTHIEPLLELRTWHTMSQDDVGPVGSLRDLKNFSLSDNKKINHLGYFIDKLSEKDEPTPEEIMAALEKSTEGLVHKPLYIKETTTKRKFYNKRKNNASTK